MSAEQKSLPTDSKTRRQFPRSLLRWYETHKRDLPWRRTRDPYSIWLSEIMLQQTRVNAVRAHYRAFLRRFPTVRSLAAARESSVLASWSGLGYYRRARMLHAAAKAIVKKHAGKFPANAAQLRTLPGIGRYTAAAVASIAFQEPVAVVDGNVGRVLQRVMGETLAGENLWHAAQELLNRNRPGDFNQAMMELGATVCLPGQPRCAVCPVFDCCATRGDRDGRRSGTRQKKREVDYLLDCRNGSVLLVRRPKSTSLMPGMWELPQATNMNGKSEAWLTLRHSITVTDYLVRVMRRRAQRKAEGHWVPKERVPGLALTGLARKILRAARII